ncbi:MAG: ATP-binding protein [Myxococcales bacterium]|nr:ATP-binding protein [Myxococcales bacterium]
MTTEHENSAVQVQRAKVDMDGLMEVLSANLYSTPFVALRELVQNAHDSCFRRKIEDEACDISALRIDISVSASRSLLTIQDRGAGLTEEEIHRYLATVGSGYTRVLRKESAREELIGAFGLGFLSAYVIAERVEVWTTSYQTPDQTWHFSSRNGQSYTVHEAENEEVGTRVVLHLKPRFASLTRLEAVSQVLERYCCLLTIPIYAPHQINAVRPPWEPQGHEISELRMRRLRLDFAKRFEPFFEPLATLPVESKEEINARGVLWVQDGATYGSSDNRRVVLFVRGMLITEDARELFPRWAGFLGGVIECNQLTPTASREDVQEDENFSKLAKVVEETLITGLAHIAAREPEAWRRILMRHNEALLGAALCDERLFALLQDELTVPTSEGDLRLPALRKHSHGKIYLSMSQQAGYEEVLFRALSRPIVQGWRYAARPFVQQFCEMRGLEFVELGTRRGEEAVFAIEDLEESKRALFAEHLAQEDTELCFARFAPETLPVIIVTNHEVALKRRIEDDEADKRIASGVLGLARKFTKKVKEKDLHRLYVNLNSPLIQKLMEVGEPQRTQGMKMVRALAQLMSPRAQVDTHHDLADSLKLFCDTLCLMLGDSPKN